MSPKLRPCLTMMLLMQLAAPFSIFAQEDRKWNVGVSAGLTAERFGVTTSFVDQDLRKSSYSHKAASWANFGGAIWMERKLSPSWSLIPQVGYQLVQIKENVLTGATQKSGGMEMKETHHNVSLAIHLRKYLILNSRIKLFADAGVKADRMVRFKNEYWRYQNDHWNPAALRNVNPAMLFAAGVKRDRWALSVNYQYFLGTPFSKEYRDNMRPSTVITEIERQNLGVNVAFTILK